MAGSRAMSRPSGGSSPARTARRPPASPPATTPAPAPSTPCRRPRACLLPDDLLDRRRQAQGRRHRLAGGAFPPHRPCLPHRRGRAQLRCHLGGPRPLRHLRRPRDRARRGAVEGASRRQAGRRGAAVAGLRVVRSVRRFRSARRGVSAPGQRAGGGAPAMTAIARSDTSVLGRWWWTVDRWTLAALAAIIRICALLILAARPAVGPRLGFGGLFFLGPRP